MHEGEFEARKGKSMDHEPFWFGWQRSLSWLACTWNYAFGAASSIFRMRTKFFQIWLFARFQKYFYRLGCRWLVLVIYEHHMIQEAYLCQDRPHAMIAWGIHAIIA